MQIYIPRQLFCDQGLECICFQLLSFCVPELESCCKVLLGVGV